MAARLKVFGWSDGFHSWTVATTSRPKALEAWNVEQDLFKSGLAHEVETGPERDAAPAAPGSVIKTGLAIDPGKIEAVKPKTKPKPDQALKRKTAARIRDVQDQIDALETQSASEIERLEAERAALDRELETLTSRRDKALESLRKQLRAAKTPD